MARVVSFRPRRDALTANQQRTWDTRWPHWGALVPFFDHGPGGIAGGVPPPGQVLPAPLDTAAWFGRNAPLVLEIGSGTGTATAVMAATEPDVDVLAVEVYRPGIAQLFAHCERAGVTNVRALHGDAVTVLRHLLGPGSLAAVRVFFPDPWPKRKHGSAACCSRPWWRSSRHGYARAGCSTRQPTSPTTRSRSRAPAMPSRC